MPRPLQNLLASSYRKRTGHDIPVRFEAIPLPQRTILVKEGTRPKHVHLVTSGVASVVSMMKGGEAVEVGMAGYESFPESTYLLGPQRPPKETVMQVGGSGLRTTFREFEEEFQRNAVLRGLVLQAVQYEALTIAQIAACNGLHQIEERLARWLMMVEDRTGDPNLPLTQEYLAQMLGARRSSVTMAAGNLQRAGLIEYKRGNIRIESREGLEEVACECYGLIRGFFDNIYA